MKLFITVAGLTLILNLANAKTNIILADPKLKKMINVKFEENLWETPDKNTYSKVCRKLNEAVIFGSFGENKTEIRQNSIKFPGVEEKCNTVGDKFLNFDEFAFVHVHAFCCTYRENSSVYIAKYSKQDYYLLFGSEKNHFAVDSDESYETNNFSEDNDSSYDIADKNVYLQAVFIQHLTKDNVKLMPKTLNPEGLSFSLYSPEGFEIYRFCATLFSIRNSISYQEGVVYTVTVPSTNQETVYVLHKGYQNYSYSNCNIQKLNKDKKTGLFKLISRI